MSDTKISALPAVTTPAGTDEYPVNQGGTTKKTTLAQIDTYVNTANVFAAGSTTAGSWPKFTSGTVLTTPEAGAIEYDGKAHYATRSASERGVVPAEQLITLTSDFTTAGGTTALQKLFNSPTNGALTVAANVSLMFECMFDLTTMSASTGTFSFGFGGTATFTRVKWFGISRKTSQATGTAANFVMGVAATATVMNATNTTTTGHAWIQGKLVIGTGGTIIPSFATSVANATVVKQDSYFRCWPMGSNTVQSIGNWS